MKKQFWLGFVMGLASIVTIMTMAMIIILLTGNSIDGFGNNVVVKQTKDDIRDSEAMLSKMNLLEAYIDKYYIDEVDDKDLAEGVYKGLVNSLGDPYSAYYTAEEYTAMMESTSGIYAGIGCTVSQDVKTGIISIVKPFEGSPAFEAGILPGDMIVKVDEEEVSGKDLTEVVTQMKGKEGTQVTVSIYREGETEPKDYLITRKKIEIPTVVYEMLEGEIGYIAISAFEEVTAPQFRAALDDLEKQGAKGLVIDLRNNGGGLLTTVVDMLDRMLPKGMIVYTEDKNGVDQEYTSSGEEQYKKPMAVLINGNSASASEVFAGAIQDYKLGDLVGTTSFGKGIVQSIVPITELNDGSAIKLTTSKYYTPKGRNIHGIGIEPDVSVELTEGLAKKVVIEKTEDNQLQKAVESVMGKIKK